METTKFVQKEFLDILFESRNRDYGAYDHRIRYNRRVRNAVIGMAAVMMVVIGGYAMGTLRAKDRTIAEKPVITPTTLTDVNIPPPEIPVVPPPPPAHTPPPPPAAPTIKHTVFKVVENDQVNPEDEVPKNDDLMDKAIGAANLDGDPDGVDLGVPDGMKGSHTVVEAPKAEKRNEPFIIVEIMPEFPGGEKELMKFLQNNMRYPHMAQENGVQGVVFVKFVVGKDGLISMVETVGAKKGAGLEEEALRVVRKMPKWKPGRQNGENVPVYFNLPINFKMMEQ